MSLSSYTGCCSSSQTKAQDLNCYHSIGFYWLQKWTVGLRLRAVGFHSWLCVFIPVWIQTAQLSSGKLPLCKHASAACRLMSGLNSALWIALRFSDTNHCNSARYDEWIVSEYLIKTSLAFLSPGESIACMCIKCSHCVQLLLHFCCSLHVAGMSYKQTMPYQAESHFG